MDIKDASIKQLQEEIKKRIATAITMKNSVDLTKLVKLLKDYMDYILSDDFHEDNDYETHIYECVMETFYGIDFFKFYNERLK